AGLIIHETRFTYKAMGLQKVADTGEYWDKMTGMPIPLGGIVISRNVPEETAMKVSRTIRRSLEYARVEPEASYAFIRDNAQEISTDVMKEHIDLYVNRFTLSLGAEGHEAVERLYAVATERKVIPQLPDRIFLIS
ncbi:MAG: 1,4-dihydroxy-6-naphthoate synthase, partial [Bacteroidales bacterium]|nr:1,4-dihydroxy-6-naphthoate synthase [Bacteroidales bacterium]